MNRTFSIIKPDAVKRNLIGQIKPDAVERGLIGDILKDITDTGFKIIALKLTQISINEAETFYSVHKERPFFNSLVDYMTSGPVQVQVLEGNDAVSTYRKIMGATNPADAEEGTIRKLYAESIEANSVHGSDSDDNAKIEIEFFFSGSELV